MYEQGVLLESILKMRLKWAIHHEKRQFSDLQRNCVGDQGHSKIMRVSQEKVNGVYQGACFPFVEGFASGVLRLEWNPQNESIYVGMTSRGWASTGPAPYALERLVWNGETPFEIKTIKTI